MTNSRSFHWPWRTIAHRRPLLFVLLATLATAPSVLADSPLSFEDASDRLGFVRTSVAGDTFAGVAWLDYDGDGDLDLFLTNGRGQPNALFRNAGDGTFSDVAEAAGVADRLGHSGVVAGDLDNDGHTDLFLAGDGGVAFGLHSPTRLYRNRGDGTFEDVSEGAGVPGAETSGPAALADVDRDGDLDLFVGSPGSFTLGTRHPSKLYQNDGDMTFTDISDSSGVSSATGACAAGFTDFDRDGWLDLLVAICNRMMGPAIPELTPLMLFRNNHDFTFTDVAAAAGMTDGGLWMSATFGDYDNDGDIDVFSTNMGTSVHPGTLAWGHPMPHALYRNEGDGTFTNVALEAGAGVWEFAWGASFADFDDDGDLDLFFTGSLPAVGVIGPGQGNPGRLLLNDGAGRFTDGSEAIPIDMSSRITSGVAHGDLDGDGAADLVVGVETSPTIVLRNQGNGRSWITVRAIGTESNRSAIGARVEVIAGELRQVREIQAGSSFYSSETPWPTFGLGDGEGPVEVRVAWPSGTMESFAGIGVRQLVTVKEGEGASVAP